MMKELKELMKKKAMKGDIMSDNEREATSSVLKDLDSLADEGIAGSMKKVTVASDSEEGLEEGLDKAKEVVEEMPEMEEDSEEVSEDDLELEDMSEEELDAMIEMLMEKKNKSMPSE